MKYTIKETDRVRANTRSDINARIDERTQENINKYAGSSEQTLAQRIRELEEEWDIERVLETNAATLAFLGLVLGATKNKSWLILTGVVTGFLALHAIRGWCPPLELLRRMGVRTRQEIEREKYALKALRGDFDNVYAAAITDVDAGVRQALHASEKI